MRNYRKCQYISMCHKMNSAWKKLTYDEPFSLYAGIILCMRQTNERRRYNVTSPLIGCAHTQNYPCLCNTLVIFMNNEQKIPQNGSFLTHIYKCLRIILRITCPDSFPGRIHHKDLKSVIVMSRWTRIYFTKVLRAYHWNLGKIHGAFA